MSKRLPLHPKHPERICWGCDHYCAADDMRCGNGTDRAQHPVELWGDDWHEHTLDAIEARDALDASIGTDAPTLAVASTGAVAEPGLRKP